MSISCFHIRGSKKYDSLKRQKMLHSMKAYKHSRNIVLNYYVCGCVWEWDYISGKENKKA